MKKTLLVVSIVLLVASAMPSAFADCKSEKSAPPQQTSAVLKAVLVEVDLDLIKQTASDKAAFDPHSMSASKLMSLLDNKKAAQIIAQSTLVVTGNSESETSQVDRVNQPIKQTVTASGVEPYYITKYQWVEKSVDFSAYVESSDENQLSGKFSFNYTAGYKDDEDDEDDDGDSDVIVESNFVAKGSVLLKKNVPVLTSVAINSETARFLILNADF